MQYAVTVYVLHTVFSAFGIVQKIAIFEKNGVTQALIQYPDVTTARVAKESLEGHCIYDGDYCKLHLSHSRHTDPNVKAYCDKSRDYTVQDPSLLTAQQILSVPASPAVWQNHQVTPMYTSVPRQVPPGQVPSWNPSTRARPPTYLSAAGTFPGQTYPQSPVPASATAPTPAGSSPLSQPAMPSTQPGVPPARPGGALPPGHPPYYIR